MMTEAKDDAPRAASKAISEPELLTLWRRLIAARDKLAARLASWEELGAHHQRRWASMTDLPEEELKERRDLWKLAAKNATDAITVLGLRIREIDEGVEKGTRRDSKKDRGITITQLGALIERAELDPDRDAQLLAFVVQYLEQVRANDRHAKLTRGTVQTLLSEAFGASDVDVDRLAQTAREQLTAENEFRTHENVSNRMLKIVRAWGLRLP